MADVARFRRVVQGEQIILSHVAVCVSVEPMVNVRVAFVLAGEALALARVEWQLETQAVIV